VPAVQCAVHPDAEADRQCTVCKREMCEACATYEVDGHAACDGCGRKEMETSKGIATALFACVGVGYLATIAIAVSLSPPRPYHGGLAAVVAIALGRGLQLWLKPRTVTPRPTA
jgi:hypothetical protein